MVIVKKKAWERLGEKWQLINRITKNTNIDLKIYEKEEFNNSYPRNLTLIHELSSSKILHGSINLPKRSVTKLDIMMKIDDSIKVKDMIEENGISYITGKELYSAIRNICIINQAIDGIINSTILNRLLEELMGRATVQELKQGDKEEYKKIASIILDILLVETQKRIRKWENNKILIH